MTTEPKPHHVEARARLPVSNAVIPVWLGRLDGAGWGWLTHRPRPFPSERLARAGLDRYRQKDFEYRLVKDSERLVPA